MQHQDIEFCLPTAACSVLREDAVAEGITKFLSPTLALTAAQHVRFLVHTHYSRVANASALQSW